MIVAARIDPRALLDSLTQSPCGTLLARKLDDRWPDILDRLATITRYAVLPAGKLLRPLLTLHSAAAAGGRPEDIVAAALGVEYLHVATLAHDDIIDGALAGFPDPGPALRLPLAVVLFDKVQQRRISFRTAPFIGLALLQEATEPARGVPGRASRLARPKAMRLLAAIDAHEGHTGVFSFDPWPAALLCLGLAHAREAPGLVMAITGFLRRAVRVDGAWDAVTNLDLTRSAFATSGLVGSTTPPTSATTPRGC